MTRFSTLHHDEKTGAVSETNVRVIRQSDLRRCPHFIMMPEHYRDTGHCRCDDPEHTDMRDWGYKWSKGQWR